MPKYFFLKADAAILLKAARLFGTRPNEKLGAFPANPV